jgi:hypothetical protein
MARYGISTADTLGVPMPVIRRLAKEAGRNHELAAELWACGIHEARILATLVEEPARVTRRQMNRWAHDFDSWDVCDQDVSIRAATPTQLSGFGHRHIRLAIRGWTLRDGNVRDRHPAVLGLYPIPIGVRIGSKRRVLPQAG